MSTQGVLNFYGHDHDELDDFLKQFQSLKSKEYAQARAFFRKFKFEKSKGCLDDALLCCLIGYCELEPSMENCVRNHVFEKC